MHLCYEHRSAVLIKDKSWVGVSERCQRDSWRSFSGREQGVISGESPHWQLSPPHSQILITTTRPINKGCPFGAKHTGPNYLDFKKTSKRGKLKQSSCGCSDDYWQMRKPPICGNRTNGINLLSHYWALTISQDSVAGKYIWKLKFLLQIYLRIYHRSFCGTSVSICYWICWSAWCSGEL